MRAFSDSLQLGRVEAVARREPAAQRLGVARAVEPVAARRVAVDVPRVDVPVRQSPLDRVRLDRPRRRPRSTPASGTRARRPCAPRSRASAWRPGPPRRRPAASASATSSNTPNVSSSLARTRSSGECAPAAIIGPTNSSASRIARASSGVSRGGPRNVSPKSSLSTLHLVAVQLRVDRVAAAAEVHEVQQREMLLERLGRDREALDELARRDHGLALLAARGEQVREQRLQHAEALGRDRAGRAVGAARRASRRRPRRRARAARPRARWRAARSALGRRAGGGRAARAESHGRPGAAPSARAARARRTR